ncbi:heat shock factor-binding protein isoform X1 [Cucumis sativus]|uniref:heat shock factor-binding protein isoform X1 n=1 Tax=Cucumis sativus TaxID=3659 RepID=UPI0002B40B8E|nr:heat shock factor-binding protein isoform X1 [Cucumis sativus]
MDGHDSEDAKQSTADMTIFVQNLLQQMVSFSYCKFLSEKFMSNKIFFMQQSRFQTMSDSIITKIDEMGSRINELEQSINDLKAEMGVEGSPSPLPPSKPVADEVKKDEGSA